MVVAALPGAEALAAGGAAVALGGGCVQGAVSMALRAAGSQAAAADREGGPGLGGLLRLRGGAKSKNHTNHNQSAKAHKNGIKRVKT